MELTAFQKLVLENLNRFDRKFGQMYEGALHALDNPRNVDRLAQSAHSIRDISYNLFVVTKPSKDITHKDQFMNMFDPQRRLPSHMRDPYEAWMELYDWFSAVAHHGKETTETEFLEKLDQFEVIAFYLLRSHFDAIKEIDSLLGQEDISADYFQKSKILLSVNFEAYRYFFSKADHRWLKILVESGYFANPPPVIRKDGMVSFPPWPESGYLARVCEKDPETVCKVIVACCAKLNDSDDNPLVLEDFVTAAKAMEPRLAKQIADISIKQKWVNRYLISSLNERLIELAQKFVEIGDAKKASAIVRNILELELSPHVAGRKPTFFDIIGKISSYNYEEITKKRIPQLFKDYPVEGINLLASILRNAISTVRSANGQTGNEDYSYVWRPAIEDSDQNSMHDSVKDLVIEAIRDLIEYSGQNKPEAMPEIIALLEKQKYPIFKRMILHTYRVFSSAYLDKINAVLSAEFDNLEISHEYYMLLKQSFPELEDKTKAQIIDLIDKGPDTELFKKRTEERTGSPASEREIGSYVQNWKARQVEPILQHMTDEWRQLNAVIVEKVSTLEFNGFHAYHWVSAGDSKEKTEIDEMNPIEAMKFMKSYQPEGFFGGLDNSTARKLSEQVASQPTDYSKLALELEASPQVVVYYFLSGLVKALREGKSFEWSKVLMLCSNLTERASESGGFKDDHLPKTIGSLLYEGLSKKDSSVPFSERSTIWNMIKKMDSQRYDDSNWEDGYPGSNRDAIMVAINSVRGNIMHAVIGYIIWCHIHLKESGKGGIPDEAKEVLMKYLDASADASVSARAVFGMFFINLFAIEKQWASENAGAIFGPEDVRLSQAAWEGYLASNVYRDVFKELIPFYQKHLQIASQNLQNDSLPENQQQLVGHIVIAYLLDYEEADSLFSQFRKSASPKMLDHAIWRVNFELAHYKRGETRIKLDKIKRMWRDEKFQTRPDLAGWFIHSPFDPKFTVSAFLGNLQKSDGKTFHIHSVGEHLAKYAKDFPEETVSCLEQLIKGYPQGWEIYSMRNQVKSMIIDIKSSGDASLVERANRVVNQLGSLGFDEFRSLL